MIEQLAALTKAAKPMGDGLTAQVDLARAALAEANGESNESLAILESIIDSWDRMSNRFLGTVGRIEAARVAGLLGKGEDHVRLLDEAESLGDAMGARRFLDQIIEMRGEAHEASASL